jgi:hypothetical protein
MDKELLQIFFPSGLLEYFKVVSYKKRTNEYIFYIDELNIAPEGYTSEEIESKGFYNQETIKDFPIRGKRCIYKLRRRKWIVKKSQKIIMRNWDIITKGTRLTNEFATFLKGINR